MMQEKAEPRYFDKTKPKSLRPLKVDCLNIRKIEKFLSNQTDATNEGTYQRTFFLVHFTYSSSMILKKSTTNIKPIIIQQRNE